MKYQFIKKWLVPRERRRIIDRYGLSVNHARKILNGDFKLNSLTEAFVVECFDAALQNAHIQIKYLDAMRQEIIQSLRMVDPKKAHLYE